VSRRKPRRRRADPLSTLTAAQGEFHQARTFLAIAARVLDRMDDNPADPDLRVRVSPADVAWIAGLGLKQLDAGVSHLDEGLTDVARGVSTNADEKT
jgi:hypothetical protein